VESAISNLIEKRSRMGIRVLICGGRDYANAEALREALDRVHAERKFGLVITGGARGADTMAHDWAISRGIAVDVYIAEWDRLGRKAGPIRNQRMLLEGKPDLVIAFPGGRGTVNMIGQANPASVEVIRL
jgi:predicted Rossmann-fold nucleotide-binding protein